jgi:ABC-2 type transport system ATP-binding protein
VDIGAPQVLVRRHCPERTVIVATDHPHAADILRTLPVDAVAIAGSQVTIRGRGDEFVTRVIQCIAEHQMRVTDFRTEVPTLEDVFLRLTGKDIRA